MDKVVKIHTLSYKDKKDLIVALAQVRKRGKKRLRHTIKVQLCVHTKFRKIAEEK